MFYFFKEVKKIFTVPVSLFSMFTYHWLKYEAMILWLTTEGTTQEIICIIQRKKYLVTQLLHEEERKKQYLSPVSWL